MKKLILSAAIVLGGLTAPSLSAAVQDFKEVKLSDLPQSVKDAIEDEFNDATISKAYVNSKGDYKLQLSTEEQDNLTVYTNAKGQLVQNELKKQ